MDETILEKNGYILGYEYSPHNGPKVLVLYSPKTKTRLIGESIIDAIANLEDYYDRLDDAKKSSRNLAKSMALLLNKLDPDGFKNLNK